MSKKKMNVYFRRRVVGYVENTVFYREISGSKHFLQSPRAIMFAEIALEDAIILGAKSVNVFDRETSIFYFASVEKIKSDGFFVDKGFGRQIAMRLGAFNQWKQAEMF